MSRDTTKGPQAFSFNHSPWALPGLQQAWPPFFRLFGALVSRAMSARFAASFPRTAVPVTAALRDICPAFSFPASKAVGGRS